MSAVFLATLRQRGSQFTLGTDIGGATGNVLGTVFTLILMGCSLVNAWRVYILWP